MKKTAMLIMALTGSLYSGVLLAQEALSVDQKIDRVLGPVAQAIEDFFFYPIPFLGNMPFIVLWLILAATFFTLYFKFVNLRCMGLGLKITFGKCDDPNAPGEITHFQALTTALSGTVGLGNIAGVAVAVSAGGPGATFWMIVAGLLGMSTKFVECTLGVKYRDILPNGEVLGGPMRYLSKGLKEKGYAGLGKVLAVLFAIMCIGGSFGGGNMYQVNQAYEQFLSITGGAQSPFAGQGWLFGVVIAIFVGLVIIGGIKSIGRVTAKLVPLMAIIYMATGLFIIFSNVSVLPEALASIVREAFSPSAAFGGFLGVLIMGFRRAAFSNEAGVGSAAIAHSAVKTNYPATEGLVALWEPFIDTVVVCTITALVIIITGVSSGSGEMEGIALTSAAFATSGIVWFPYVLAVAAILFAFSTMISWSYYGMQAWVYLFGAGRAQENTYKVIFLIFIVIGAAIKLGSVLQFSDAMIFAMSVPNIIGLYFLAPVVKRELQRYMQALKSGQLHCER